MLRIRRRTSGSSADTLVEKVVDGAVGFSYDAFEVVAGWTKGNDVHLALPVYYGVTHILVIVLACFKVSMHEVGSEVDERPVLFRVHPFSAGADDVVADVVVVRAVPVGEDVSFSAWARPLLMFDVFELPILSVESLVADEPDSLIADDAGVAALRKVA